LQTPKSLKTLVHQIKDQGGGAAVEPRRQLKKEPKAFARVQVLKKGNMSHQVSQIFQEDANRVVVPFDKTRSLKTDACSSS
jgi:hypothetical protein